MARVQHATVSTLPLARYRRTFVHYCSKASIPCIPGNNGLLITSVGRYEMETARFELLALSNSIPRPNCYLRLALLALLARPPNTSLYKLYLFMIFVCVCIFWIALG